MFPTLNIYFVRIFEGGVDFQWMRPKKYTTFITWFHTSKILAKTNIVVRKLQ